MAPEATEEAEVAETAAALSGGEAILIDVREDFEWAMGHAEGAHHIPLRELPGRVGELSRAAPVYLICATGNRSARAAEYLRAAGFERAINVRGGTAAWRRAGLPMSRRG